MKKSIIGAVFAAAALSISSTAGAVTWSVQVVNATDLNSAQSQATIGNFNTQWGAGIDGSTRDVFDYTDNGALDFRTTDGNDGTTIKSWLESGSGLIAGLDTNVGALQNSKPNIYATPGTATSTFYLFTTSGAAAQNFDITHDDGVWIFDDGISRGGDVGPTGEVNTSVSGFDGGKLEVLYVSTNGDPSILEMDVAAVPLPGAVWLFGSALVGLAGIARRRNQS